MSTHPPTRIDAIEKGVVFLLARWSGPSVLALRELGHAIANVGISSEELCVFDLEEHPEVYAIPELADRVFGWGEALVVRKGAILGFHVLGRDSLKIHQRIAELLADLSA